MGAYRAYAVRLIAPFVFPTRDYYYPPHPQKLEAIIQKSALPILEAIQEW